MNTFIRKITITALCFALVACSKDDGVENDVPLLTIDQIDIQLTPVDFSIADIDFLDAQRGFIIDNQGRILKTENSAIDWTVLHTTNYELIDIQFTSTQHGYVLAKLQNESSYILLSTSDSGETFHETPIPNGSDLRKLYITSNHTAFVLGNHILKTEDNGLNWSELNLEFNAWGDLIEHHNGALYTCGLNGSFLKSTTNGTSWEQIDLETNTHLYQIKPFEDVFYFRGQKIVKTRLETTQELDLPGYILDFKPYKSTILMGFGEQYPVQGFYPNGAIYISNDSGTHWETTIFDEFNRIRVVDFVDARHGFGIADNLFNGTQYLISIKIED